MNNRSRFNIPILPYSLIKGQDNLKMALELAFIVPELGGVLISGERGTGKSTAVRAFALMMYDHLPVTLPINATEDRVVGGWSIDQLLEQKATWQDGLLVEAHNKMLYIDEVNLLDDHIVNVILDTASTGLLSIQREGQRLEESVSFTLVGTMNPEEGNLRPQLLDRFGLMVNVKGVEDEKDRKEILKTIVEFDEALRYGEKSDKWCLIDKSLAEDKQRRETLIEARNRFFNIYIPENIKDLCVKTAMEFQAEGHRADYTMVFAARAKAALDASEEITIDHLRSIVEFSIHHRRPEYLMDPNHQWTNDDASRLEAILRDG